jgi:hypothetical protein
VFAAAAATTASATAVSPVAVSLVAVSSVAASSAKPDTECEPIVDDGRLIDWRDDVVVRLGIDGLGARVALPVGVEIVPGGGKPEVSEQWQARRPMPQRPKR